MKKVDLGSEEIIKKLFSDKYKRMTTDFFELLERVDRCIDEGKPVYLTTGRREIFKIKENIMAIEGGTTLAREEGEVEKLLNILNDSVSGLDEVLGVLHDRITLVLEPEMQPPTSETAERDTACAIGNRIAREITRINDMRSAVQTIIERVRI